IVPAMTGKIEMVFEGESEGPINVANNLIGKSLRKTFDTNCPPLEKTKKKGSESQNLYKHIIHWFDDGNQLDLALLSSDKNHQKTLDDIEPLKECSETHFTKATIEDQLLLKELVLFGLSENSKLSRQLIQQNIHFKDLFGSVFTGFSE